MSMIKGKNTKPEMLVRKFLHANGYRFRLHVKDLKGKPDIVLPKHKTIIDVRGCFWHNHKGCKFGEAVSTTSSIVTQRRRSAELRDIQNEKNWRELGWNIIIIWAECQLEPKRKNSDKREVTLKRILTNLKSGNTSN